MALAALCFALVVLGGVWLDGRAPSASAAPLHLTWPGSLVFTPFVSGVTLPTYITSAGDGTGRVFIVERQGRIRLVKAGVLQATPFLDISARVTSAGTEQGLLSVAFPPNYASKGYFYVDYTNTNGIGDTTVSRFHLSGNPDVADPNSEQVLFNVTQPFANHNGGQLQFGPDGFLYVGLGDGGSGGDPFNNGQTTSTLLGKLLRINVEPSASPPASVSGPFNYLFPVISKAASGLGYTIPITNPYAQTAGYRGEIWALGLRNPWRFTFDRQTNDLYIADVGQNTYEEIDFQPAASLGGENYGWVILEGMHCYPPGTTGCTPPARYAAPIAEYDHSFGCSVTGGYVYRGPGNATMQGVYFFGDYCSGRIWGLQKDISGWHMQLLATPAINISTFGEDQAGNLYVASYSDGIIYQITAGP
jgi:glucose/arabinose dehydrogenase